MSTILCVESEPATAMVLERTLRDLGYRTVMTVRVDEALGAASRQSFDLILAADRLPDASGIDLLRALHEQAREIPVIVMTDHSSVDGAVTCMRHGAIEYLTRPLRVEALRLAVNNALEVARLRRENAEYRRQIVAQYAPADVAKPGRPARIAWPANEAGGVATAEAAPGESYDLTEMERGAIRRALTATSGNRTRAARLLGISERTLRKKLNSGFLEGR